MRALRRRRSSRRPRRSSSSPGATPRKTLFGTGDALVIRGGAAQGIKAGDEFFIRRIVDDKFSEHEPGVYPVSISTAGAAQIVEAQNEFSIAVVTYGCDGVIEGDYLERFELRCRPRPCRCRSGLHVSGPLILGAERRQIGGPATSW